MRDVKRENAMRPEHRSSGCAVAGDNQRLCLLVLQFITVLTVLEVSNSQTILQRDNTLTLPSFTITVNNNSDSARVQQIKSNVRRTNRRGQYSVSSNKTESKVTVPGKAGIDYPTLDFIPTTSFTCSGRPPGYYADQESRCQVFHVCYSTTGTAKQSFLCPNGTIFNQQLRICEWWTKLNCQNMITSAHNSSTYSKTSAYDMMGSQTVNKEIKFTRMTGPQPILTRTEQKSYYLLGKNGNNRHNSTEGITGTEMKLLLDNVFANFTDHKVRRRPINVNADQVKKKTHEVSSSKNISRDKHVNRGTTTYTSNNGGLNRDKNEISNRPRSISDKSPSSNNYGDMKTLIPLVDNDRLTMIDKLIYGTGTKLDGNAEIVNRSSTGRNQVTYENVTVEIIPSVSASVGSSGKAVDLNQFDNALNSTSYSINNNQNKSSKNALLIQNLNTEFVRYKTITDRIYKNSETVNNSVIEHNNNQLKNIVSNPVRYGLYYSVNGYNTSITEQHKPLIDNQNKNTTNNLFDKRFSLLDALSERFQKNSNNYNEDIRVRQNVVIPSVPKVSDVLSRLNHLNLESLSQSGQKVNNDNRTILFHQDITETGVKNANFSPEVLANRSSNFNQQNTKQNKFNRKIIILNSTMTNEEIQTLFTHLKELDKNKVKINGKHEKTLYQGSQPQVEITQRPVYRSHSIASGSLNSKNYDKPQTQNITGSHDYSKVPFITKSDFNSIKLSDNKTLLGSTALYGIDLLASTMAINNNRNRALTVNRIQTHKKPALTLFDIHTINQLQDSENANDMTIQSQTRRELKHVNGVFQNTNFSHNIKPVYDKNVVVQIQSPNGKSQRRPDQIINRSRGFSQFHSDQKHDPVIVLPSLGFSLNSEDDIKAFNYAISAGLLNEKR